MKNIKQVLIILFCVVAAVFSVILISRAATTIGTNISTGGSLDVVGNVGIGTTTPDASLSVTASVGSLTGDQFIFQVSSTTNSTNINNFVITAAGNVGIGTTTPTDELGVYVSQDDSTQVESRNNYGGAESNAGFMTRSDNAAGFFGTNSSLFDGGAAYGNALGHFADRTGILTYDNATGIDFISSQATADIRFYTGGVLVANERMRIGSDGNVGIGTTSPQTILDVFSTGTSTIEIDTNSAKGGCLKIRDVDGAGYTYCYVLNGTMTCSTESCE